MQTRQHLKDDHSSKSSFLSIVLALMITCLLAGFIVKSQDQQTTVNIFVNDPRPVAQAIRELEQNCGCVITYEDPRYLHNSEIVDVTQTVRKHLEKFGPGEAPRVVRPKRGTLALEYSSTPGTKIPINTADTIQRLLNTHASGNGAGRFRLEKDGKTFHVVPITFKDALGNLTPQESLLETSISLPAEERSGAQTLNAICAAITGQSQASVNIGTFPLNLFLQYHDIGAVRPDKAKNVLSGLLESVDPSGHLSWRLLNEPGTNNYVLNIHRVPALSR